MLINIYVRASLKHILGPDTRIILIAGISHTLDLQFRVLKTIKLVFIMLYSTFSNFLILSILKKPIF